MQSPKQQQLLQLPLGIIGVVCVKAGNLYAITTAGLDTISTEKLEKGKMYNVTANVNDYHCLIISDGEKGWVCGENGTNLELVR